MREERQESGRSKKLNIFSYTRGYVNLSNLNRTLLQQGNWLVAWTLHKLNSPESMVEYGYSKRTEIWIRAEGGD